MGQDQQPSIEEMPGFDDEMDCLEAPDLSGERLYFVLNMETIVSLLKSILTVDTTVVTVTFTMTTNVINLDTLTSYVTLTSIHCLIQHPCDLPVGKDMFKPPDSVAIDIDSRQ